MGNPDVAAQSVPVEQSRPELIDHSTKIVVVDVQFGFLGKEIAELLDQMQYPNVSVITLDAPVRNTDELKSELSSAQIVLASDEESYSQAKVALGLEATARLMGLKLGSEDRHEVTPIQYGGGGEKDVARFLNLLEERLTGFGFEYPDTQDAKSG